MDKKKFTYYNIVGSIAGQPVCFLQDFCLQNSTGEINFDLKEHLEVIVIVIVWLQQPPLFINSFCAKKTTGKNNP